MLSFDLLRRLLNETLYIAQNVEGFVSGKRWQLHLFYHEWALN